MRIRESRVRQIIREEASRVLRTRGGRRTLRESYGFTTRADSVLQLADTHIASDHAPEPGEEGLRDLVEQLRGRLGLEDVVVGTACRGGVLTMIGPKEDLLRLKTAISDALGVDEDEQDTEADVAFILDGKHFFS